MAQISQKLQKNIDEMAVKLFEINAIRFGSFVLKSGLISPVYFDLRGIISYPEILVALSNIINDLIIENNIEYAHICGVPYTALSIATLVSVKANKSMLLKRKETKSYGTKKLIEGIYKENDKCVIIEDIITSGSSVLETVSDLRKHGIQVTDAIVVLDREQGGALNIENNNIKIFTLFKLSQILTVLCGQHLITNETQLLILKYISNNQCNVTEAVVDRLTMSFDKREKLATNKMAKKLFNVMMTKKSNLCLAADVTTTSELLKIVEAVGPYICLLKTHIDILDDFNDSFITKIKELSKTDNFLIMEDRKFADIGNTVKLQVKCKMYKISEWAHFLTAHSLPGSSVVTGLKAAFENCGAIEEHGVFLLAEMSSADNLIDDKYIKNTLDIANNTQCNDFISGIVCQTKHVITTPGLIQLTPGVSVNAGITSDGLGQQYNSPEYIIKEKGADIAVVGRGICNAEDKVATAKLYRDQLWTAYCERVNITKE